MKSPRATKKLNLFKTGGLITVLIILLLLTPRVLAVTGVEDYTAPSLGGLLGFIGDVTGTVVGWVVYVFNYIVATIFGVFIAIITYFIEVVLQYNYNIVNSRLVTIGFGITLAIANLGFVLAIIIIAIATILRRQTYGIKEVLWKLVAAAVLVNFSLAIAGTILTFSNTLTSYFLNSFNPAGTGSSFGAFANAIAGAFAPQKVFLAMDQGATVKKCVKSRQEYKPGMSQPVTICEQEENENAGNLIDPNKIKNAAGATKTFGGILVPLLNLFFPTIFLIIAVIAMAALWIMLLIRYVFLGILLILMPLAWLLWIFPLTKGQWQKWWDEFIRWTFFAPVVVFFIYLAILTAGGMAGQGVVIDEQGAAAQISKVIGTTRGLSPSIETMLQMAMLTAMLVAGLIIANKMGIMFAGAAVGAATAVGMGFGAWVGRRGKQLGGATLDTLRARKAAERLQRVGAGRGAVGKLLTLPVRYAGRGIEAIAVATRESLVKDAMKRLAGKTTGELSHNMSTFTAPERMAALEMLRQSGDVFDASKTGGVKEVFSRYVDQNLYKRYGQQNYYDNLTKGKGAMANPEAIQAAIIGDLKKLDDALKGIIPSITKSHIGDNKNLNDIFAGKTDEEKLLNKYQIRNLLTSNFALISSIIPKLNSSSRNNFQKLTYEALEELLNEKRIEGKDYDDLKKEFGGIMLNNTRGLIVEAGVPPTAPTATPTAGT